MSDITSAQDMERNLRRQAAKTYYYARANRWHLIGTVVAMLLALASPFVLVYTPDVGALLGATAGVWVFASRLAFEPIGEHYQRKGAAAQELFDCDVLGLPWNDALGRLPADEEIRRASKRIDCARESRTPLGWYRRRQYKKLLAWYPAGVTISWPKSVLTCQRANVVWSRRQHTAYAVFLIVVSLLWLIGGIALALTRSVTLATYLVVVALPSLPAVLDASELAKRHLEAAKRRGALEVEIDKVIDGGSATPEVLRGFQDEMLSVRRTSPAVAQWFYWILRKTFERDMQYAAQERGEGEG